MANHILYLSLTFMIICSSCATAGKFRRQHAESSIPVDLRNPKYVLLVIKDEGRWLSGRDNRAMKRFMTKWYKAPFELINKKSLDDPKYADTDKYRYYIIESCAYSITVTRSDIHTSSSTTYCDQMIVDREENKKLPSTMVLAPSFATGIKMFSQYVGKSR